MVLPNPPDSFIRELETVIFDFILNGSPRQVKRSVLVNDVCKGGLKAILLRSFMNSLKCPWIRRYCDETKGVWTSFFDIDLAKYGKDFLFHCNCKAPDVQAENLFVKQVVHAWCSATYSEMICPENINTTDME